MATTKQKSAAQKAADKKAYAIVKTAVYNASKDKKLGKMFTKK